VESGEVKGVQAFIYYVVVWKGGTKTNPVLSGTIYPEVYTYSHEQSRHALTQICERFVEWLEAHRDQITDTKIFAEE
jgi:hypothetical protein